jgi:hypothetical protein
MSANISTLPKPALPAHVGQTTALARIVDESAELQARLADLAAAARTVKGAWVLVARLDEAISAVESAEVLARAGLRSLTS